MLIGRFKNIEDEEKERTNYIFNKLIHYYKNFIIWNMVVHLYILFQLLCILYILKFTNLKYIMFLPLFMQLYCLFYTDPLH